MVALAELESYHTGRKRGPMKPVVGVFKSRPDAESGAAELVPLDIPKDQVTVLPPHATAKELAAVPTVAGEETGMGKAMGAALGGATGAIEGTCFEGLPEDEMFIYEDALRKGRSVVVVMADNDEADAVRGALENAGAESIDQARDKWWLGVRDIEKEKYQTTGAKFEDDERYFRCGFEAALHLKNRDRTYQECHKVLGDLHPRMHESEPFKRGFERGREYLKTISKHVH